MKKVGFKILILLLVLSLSLSPYWTILVYYRTRFPGFLFFTLLVFGPMYNFLKKDLKIQVG